MKGTSQMKNVTLAFTNGVSASQLGIALEQDSTREVNPVVDAIVTVRYENGDIHCLNSNMDIAGALELASYAQADVMQEVQSKSRQILESE